MRVVPAGRCLNERFRTEEVDGGESPQTCWCLRRERRGRGEEEGACLVCRGESEGEQVHARSTQVMRSDWMMRAKKRGLGGKPERGWREQGEGEMK